MTVDLTLLSGFSGVLLPYSIQTDDSFSLMLVGVFFLYAFLFGRCRKYLFQQVRNFFSVRNRNSFFSETNMVDLRYLIALFVLSCISVGMTAYHFVMQTFSGALGKFTPVEMMFLLVGGSLLYFCLKLLAYFLVCATYFDRSQVSSWMDTFLLIVYFSGILLFPFLLVFVFAGVSAGFCIYLLAGLLIFSKILIFCKWFRLFFVNVESLFLLILYFCALEIIPFSIFYRAIDKILVVF